MSDQAWIRKEELAAGVTLYLGDCRDILPTLGPVDAIVTDPPYGIGESAAKNRTRGDRKNPGRDFGADDWDRDPASPEVIQWIRENSRHQIIFGGNYFHLPPSSCWLVWDKENSGDFADAELAWTNLPKAVRLLRWMWNGMLRKGREERVHLTQKPLGVMKWCLSHLPKDVALVCDPYCGSGTTGVAAVQAGLRFIGIEREPRYFEIACRRITEALRAPDLFVAPPPVAPKQEAFL